MKSFSYSKEIKNLAIPFRGGDTHEREGGAMKLLTMHSPQILSNVENVIYQSNKKNFLRIFILNEHVNCIKRDDLNTYTPKTPTCSRKSG